MRELVPLAWLEGVRHGRVNDLVLVKQGRFRHELRLGRHQVWVDVRRCYFGSIVVVVSCIKHVRDTGAQRMRYIDGHRGRL